MRDFFKELNIIDILGIGVPGCLLVLLLGGDQTAELLWMAQFQYHPLAFGIVLIAVGSLAGMLIQELGDMIEKGLWLIPWLNPKIYAAHAVGIDRIDHKKLKQHKYKAPGKDLALFLKWVCGIISVLVVICAAGVFPFTMWKAAHVTDNSVWVRFPAWLGLLPLVIPVIAIIRWYKPITKLESSDLAKIKVICQANPYIQTKLADHGNTSKRTLFDGWRFVMRNLLLVFAITNLICLWKPLDLYRRIATTMVGTEGAMTGNLFWLTLIVSSVVAIMMVRYFHYAFLRYKYSLEDYIELCKNPDAAK